ncbi:MAG: hypothetical protein ABI785_14250 [Gemmatimonadales bacterium]
MRASIVLSLLLSGPGVATGQIGALDQGALVIRVGDVEIAHEQFLLQPGRRGGLTGSTLHATASYPPVRPRLQYSAILERGATQALSAFQVEFDGNTPERTVAELSRDRLTVRIASPTREAAHEYPGGTDLVALDDSVYSLWMAVADLASEEGSTLRVIYPRTGWRGRIVVTRRRVPNGPPSISVTGDITGEILLDQNGRFAGLLLPAKQVEVRRLADQ